MGVIYKLHQDVVEHIFEIKKKDPLLSCRKISAIISEKFKSKLSKSSINAVLKQSSLSMPVGRRRKARRNIVEAAGLGAFFLKAADQLLGVSTAFNEIIAQKSGMPLHDVAQKNEYMLYKHLFEDHENPGILRYPVSLKALIDSQIEPKEFYAYLTETQKVMTAPASYCQLITKSFREAAGIKIKFEDGSHFSLDGRLSTIWQSTEVIPPDLSVTFSEIKSCINSYAAGKPIVLFMGPEKGQAIALFFQFLINLSSQKKKIINIALCDNKSQELEVIDNVNLKESTPRIVFGLWPWQYGQYRKITYLDSFKFYSSEQGKKDFFIAEVNVELTQPIVNNKLILRGCALKNSLHEKVRLVILTNTAAAELPLSELVDAYLERWPNLEESYEDYNRKKELFFYTEASKAPLSLSLLSGCAEPSQGLEGISEYYLQVLDLYAKWRFFPQGYRKKDLSTMKKLFYELPCRLKKAKDRLLLTFVVPPGYAYLKDLAYACRRVNEKKIILQGACRLLMETSPRLIDNSIAPK